MKRRWIIYLGMVIIVLLTNCGITARDQVGMDMTDLRLYISFTKPIMRIYADEAQLKSFVNIYEKSERKAFDFYRTSVNNEVGSGFSFHGADTAYSSNSSSYALFHRSEIQHDLDGTRFIEVSWQEDIPLYLWWDEDGERQSEKITMTLFYDDLSEPYIGSLNLIFREVAYGVFGNTDYSQIYTEVSHDDEGITFMLCEAGMNMNGGDIGNPYFSKCPG